MSLSPARQLKYQADPNKFDLVTHKWDSQGLLVEKNPYRSFIVEGTQYFERPVNSGNLWFENNQPAGRVECKFGKNGVIESKKFNFDATHIQYEAPLKGAEKVSYELEQAKIQNAQLLAELAAIKGDAKIAMAKAMITEEPVNETETVETSEEKPKAPSLTKRPAGSN